MNGCVIKGTPIAVDFWRPTKAPEARLFFLTHLHRDHTLGLSSTWRLPIYTSPINALLLQHKFEIPKSIIRELEVGETYLLPLDPEGDYTMSVTPIDANHVPGAVMFLFQGYFGNILYSGDMRWYPELVEHPVLKHLIEARELDVLYLDNTFSAPFCRFPSREEAKKQLFDIIDSYPDHTIKISVRELGREDLLEAVARRFQERILVNQDKFKVLELLQYSDAFTNDPSQARIHAVPMSQIQVRTHERWNEESPTISIVLTALFVGWPHGPYSSQANKGIFKVMYSDHSSYDELMQMVGCLRPRRIIPIVQQWSKVGWWADPNAPDQSAKFDMSVYDHLLTYPPPDPILIPEVITRMMSQGGPLMVSHQPRRCSLRRGMAPRPRRALGVRGVVFTSPVRATESPVPSGSMTLDVSFRTDTSCSIMHPKLYFPNTDQDSSSMATQTPRKILKSRLSSSDDKDNYVTMSDLRLRIISRTKALAVSHFVSLDSEDATGNGKSSSEVLKKAKAICQSLSYVDALF